MSITDKLLAATSEAEVVAIIEKAMLDASPYNKGKLQRLRHLAIRRINSKNKI